MTDLSSGKVVASGKRGGPSVERRLAISHSALGEVWERQKARLLWLALLLQILGVHCGGEWRWNGSMEPASQFRNQGAVVNAAVRNKARGSIWSREDRAAGGRTSG